MTHTEAESVFHGDELEWWASRVDSLLEIEEERLLNEWLPSNKEALTILEGGTTTR